MRNRSLVSAGIGADFQMWARLGKLFGPFVARFALEDTKSIIW